MPGRTIPLVTDQIYHIFNRGVDYRRTFTDKRSFKRTLQGINFYHFASPSLSFSSFLRLAGERRNEIIANLQTHHKKIVEIFSYCLMPNHFHLLLRQKEDGGISKFMSNFQNSYTRYFNIREGRTGPLFLDQFKAVLIETDNQLLHVSRYIHLNPYTSFVVKTLEELEDYPWSSLPEYVQGEGETCNQDLILGFFNNKESYRKFVLDQADYQRNLETIKHLILETT